LVISQTPSRQVLIEKAKIAIILKKTETTIAEPAGIQKTNDPAGCLL
jgi:hypothetical protein